MICNNILEAIGHTPLVRLNRMPGPNSAEILVKFEAVNIGGSIKTRTAWNMLRTAEADGHITPDTIIVEPTSGNQGIGLALVGAVKGYRVVIIMPDSVSEERRKLVQHYGAEVMTTVSSDRKAKAVLEYGADIVINRKTENIGEYLDRYPTDLVLDCVGGPDLEADLQHQLARTKDFVEGGVAFIEKRQPRFQGA